MISNIKLIYKAGLALVLPISTVGAVIATPSTPKSPLIRYRNLIGYTTIGFLIGITYPVSWDLFRYRI